MDDEALQIGEAIGFPVMSEPRTRSAASVPGAPIIRKNYVN
jgi:hypothetical protein